MGTLNKLALRSIERKHEDDPKIVRRNKLLAAIHQQKQVLAARIKGETHTVERRKRVTNDAGEHVWETTQKEVRPWFFEQDDGWYVQCRYGARVLLIDGKHNAVFVPKLADVAGVLDTLEGAASAGDLDAAIAQATKRKPKNGEKPQ